MSSSDNVILERIPDNMFVGSFSHPNPAFQYTTAFLPRKLKDLFRWGEYLFGTVSAISSSASKMASYMVTEIDIDAGSNEELKRKHKEILEDKAKIYKLLTIAAKEGVYFYGNFFVTIAYPFIRHLICTKCGTKYLISKIKYDFDSKSQTFNVYCDKCMSKNKADVYDIKDLNASRVHFIRWDPKFVDINYNKYSGKEEIWVNIDAETKSKARNKEKLFLETTPMEIIKAALSKNGTLKLKEGEFFHFKNDALSGMSQDWGYPMVAWTLKLFLSMEALRKANEAISYDYLVPFRTLFPASQGGLDPFQYVNLNKWKSELIKNIKKWRRDPLHVEISPIPLGTVSLGGQGKSLLTYPEMDQSVSDILAALGIPKEIHYGGMQFKAMPLTLRMIEKFFQNSVDQLNELLQWVDDKLSDFYGIGKAKVKMVPFKLIDNLDEKFLIAQTGQTISKETSAKMYGLDYDKEREKIINESIQAMKDDMSIGAEQAKITAQQQMATPNTVMSAGNDVLIQQAQQLAQQLISMPENVRKSYIANLRKNNYVLYCIVIDQLEDIRRNNAQQGRAVIEQQGT